jgi:2-keto-4-pentenoate hydratase
MRQGSGLASVGKPLVFDRCRGWSPTQLATGPASLQIRQFSLEYPAITIEDAYAIQRRWVELRISAGRILKGHKIGLTSRAMQRSSNITEPGYI